MNKFVLILTISLLSFSCSNSNKKIENEQKVETEILFQSSDTVDFNIADPLPQKVIVLVLPPYDEIANAGISPNVQKYLEVEISNDTTFSVMKFPYKKLMGTPYHNVFDKKYCTPILEKINADIIVMSKLDVTEGTNTSLSKIRWNLQLRIYNTKTFVQKNLTLKIYNSTDGEIKSTLANRIDEIINEIKTILQ